MDYKIFPLNLGTFKKMEISNLMYQTNPGQKIYSPPILGWLILNNKEAIVVDTGGSSKEWSIKYHHELERNSDQLIENQLKKLNVNIDEVNTVINTHLHWDHCFQNESFKNAEFIVQKKEIISAINPIPSQKKYYEIGFKNVQPGWVKVIDRLKIIDGDYQLNEGIKLLHLPGHTPGLQGVLVQTKNGKYLIAGDAVGVYENWDREKKVNHIPQGIHWDLEEYYNSFAKMERYKAEVLPCHDKRVLEREYYE